jgi:hypothetical protein
MTDVAQVPATQPATPPQASAAQDPAHLWKDKSFSFHDLLDIINPLQHIPLVATVYRYLTGDTIGNVARVAGDALYGGPIGMASGIIQAGVQIDTGKDIGDHVVAMLFGDDSPGSPTPVMTAAKTPASAPIVVAKNTVSVPPTSPGGIPIRQLASAQTTDPRQAFIARAEALRAKNGGGGSSGSTLSNHVVPLEGPAALVAASSNRRVIATPFTAAPAGSAPRTILASAPATAQGAPSPNTPAPNTTAPTIRASVPTPDGPAPAPLALPNNPPIDISKQMLDALDKYAAMQQQKAPGERRGGQLDTIH